MKVTREFCDTGCGFEFKDKDKRDRTGLCVVVGYSSCGWGNRRDLLNWSGEVCRACYGELGQDIAIAWQGRYKERNVASDAGLSDVVKIPSARVNETSWLDTTMKRILKCLDSIIHL